MTRRSRAREVALQVLYQEDLNPVPDHIRSDAFVSARLCPELSPDEIFGQGLSREQVQMLRTRGQELVDLAQSLVNGVRRNQTELDSLLSRTADNWSLERMAATDRNVLRLGAYEILYTATPGRVAINEAVELAKRFGTAHSAQFVNGILDRFLAGHAGDK
jgi:transcription antitermination protein NusB